MIKKKLEFSQEKVKNGNILDEDDSFVDEKYKKSPLYKQYKAMYGSKMAMMMLDDEEAYADSMGGSWYDGYGNYHRGW